MALRFGDCRLDLEARRLLRGSREVHLPPKSFELLKFLIESRPRALSKAELLERVWPGVFVSDASLARVVSQLRADIGDSARRPRILRTVHGYGYAFAGDATGDEQTPTSSTTARPGVCWLTLGRRRFALADGEHIVGREPDATVWLDSPRVSRRHAKLMVTGGQATIEDLGSKNGTVVRDVRIDDCVPLESGDRIQIGPFALVFRSVSEFRSTETAI